MTTNRGAGWRWLRGAVVLTAGLLFIGAGRAVAQENPFCGAKSCKFSYCYQPPGGERTCGTAWAGCYTAYPCLGCCNCPIGSGACIPTTEALTGNQSPTREALLADGKLACHELVRLRLKVERAVRLFDDDSSWASISESDRVTVTGTAHPDGVPEPKDGAGAAGFAPATEPAPVRPFTCEVQRTLSGEWKQEVLTIADAEK